jgi:hypothetical protein
LFIVTAVALLAVAAGTAYATIPSAGGVIHGCFKQFTGVLRLVDANETCGRERAISWSVQGPKGDTGPAGPQGLAGPQGPAGASADFGTGAGLEKVVFNSPPPIGDQTLLQVTPAYRLPQGCSAGAVPQKLASNPGWACGDGSGGSSHAYWSSGLDESLKDFVFKVVAAVDLPAGSYVIIGKTTIWNNDADPQTATCKLSTGNENVSEVGGILDASREGIVVMDVVTFATDTTITMSCMTYYGFPRDTRLVATRVAGIN